MLTPDPAALLSRARDLEKDRDYRGLTDLLAPVDGATLLGEPELGYRLAYAWRRVGRGQDALGLVNALASPVRRRGDERLARRLLSLHAMLRYDGGEIAVAEALWEELAANAARDGDFALAAAAANNLGVVRTLQDRPEEALAAYTRALLASGRLGDRRGMAQAHQNLAIQFRELDMPREAAGHFRQAQSHARESGSEDVLGRIEEERALLFLAQGDERLARASAGRALTRLEAVEDTAGAGEALRVLGIAALRRRDADAARSGLEQALDRGERAGNALLQAETLEALALLERVEGREAEAAAHREAAARLFARMGAAPWGRRIRSRTAELAAV